MSFIPIPALPPPLLSSFHLHRPKNRAVARLGLCLISLAGFWCDPISSARRGGDRTHQCPSDATFLPQMPSGSSGVTAPQTLALFSAPSPKCSILGVGDPKMPPGHGGPQAEPHVSPCMGWGDTNSKAALVAEEEMRGVPNLPAHTPKSAWGEEVEPQGHPYHLAGTWFCHLGCSGVPVGCSGRFHASCSPGWLIPSATLECGAG